MLEPKTNIEFDFHFSEAAHDFKALVVSLITSFQSHLLLCKFRTTMIKNI